MRELQAILFDLDGTLIDSSETICASFNQTLLQFRYPPAPKDRVRRMIGRPLREMFRIATEASDDRIEDMLACYRETFGPLVPSLMRLFPGVAELIPRLSTFYSLGVVTSRSGEGTRRILAAFDLTPHFGPIVGIEDVIRSKPDPEPVHTALSMLAIEPAGAVMVGDTVDDIAAGREAGTRTVGVATGPNSAEELRRAGAWRTIDTLREIDAVLRLQRDGVEVSGGGHE